MINRSWFAKRQSGEREMKLAAIWNSIFLPLNPSDPKLRPGELSPGVIKPSYALAGVVAAYILAHPDKLTETRLRDEVPQDYPRSPSMCYIKTQWWRRKWVDDKMTVDLEEYQKYGSVHQTLSVYFRNKRYEFEVVELSLIKEAMTKAITLKEQRAAADKAAARQQAACDVMESIFAPTPAPQENDNENERRDVGVGLAAEAAPALDPV